MAVNAGSMWCLAVCSLVVTAPYVMGKLIVAFKVHADDQLLSASVVDIMHHHRYDKKLSAWLTGYK